MIGQATCKWLVGLFGILCALVGAAERARGDLTVAGYEDRYHDPFYVGTDKAFIGAGYNWSGYGRWEDPTATSSNWKQVAMISDNYFITASHNHPLRADDPVGTVSKVRFYRTTDPNGEYWESEIALDASGYVGTQIGSTDLWVGKLAQTPPSWVMRFPLAKRQEATNYLSYTDNDLFIFGQDSPRSYTSARVGRNEIDLVTVGGDYQWDYNAAAGFGRDEAQTQSGDSGGPSFFANGPVPVLAGVHTRVNYDTGVSKNLQKIISAVGEPVMVSTGLVGDLNGDFRVGATDLTYLLDGYGKSVGPASKMGDISGDGIVNIKDVNLFLDHYGQSLFAPSDFDRDGDVDGNDLATIGNNWLKSVSKPYTLGDANGDSVVNFNDVLVFDRNQFRAYFGPLPAPLAPIPGDLTGNGLVDALDWYQVSENLGRSVVPGTNGDADGNGYVDVFDQDYVNELLGSSFGDINGDLVVGPGDFLILASNWNRFVQGGRLNGDFNNDHIVNSLDANVLFGWWAQKSGTFPGMTLPEPAAATLFIWGAVWRLFVRRPRRSNRLTSRGPT